MRGFDPSSLGLIRKGNTRPDGRFTPVEYSDVMVWALNPIHFNSDVLEDLRRPYEKEDVMVVNDTTLYVDTVQIKGVVSHNESTNIMREMLPIYAGPNKVTGESPELYAYQLENSKGFNKIGEKDLVKDLRKVMSEEELTRLMGGQMTEAGYGIIKEFLNLTLGLSKWMLAYHPKLFNEYEYKGFLKDGHETSNYIIPKDKRIKTIKLNEIKDIDLNSTSNITVSADGAGSSISYPLQNLLSAGHDEIKVEWINDTFDGFWFVLHFAGRSIQGKYSQELVRHVVITDYVKHMLQNTAKEIAENTNTAVDAMQDIATNIDWDMFKEKTKEMIGKMAEPDKWKPIEEKLAIPIEYEDIEWSEYNPDAKLPRNEMYTTGDDFMPTWTEAEAENITVDDYQQAQVDAFFEAKQENKKREIEYEKDRVKREKDERKRVDTENKKIQRDVDAYNKDVKKINKDMVNYDEEKAQNMVHLVNTVVDTGQKYLYKGAEYADMKQSSSNVGGDLLGDVLWQKVGALLTVDYPTSNYIIMQNGDKVKPGDFAVNKAHTYDIKKRFKGVDDMMRGISRMYPGEIVKVDCEIVFKHGRYNNYFKELVNKGALLEWRE